MGKFRLYIGEALSQDVSLALNPQQSHYYNCNIMRLKNLSLFNGKDEEWFTTFLNGISQIRINLGK